MILRNIVVAVGILLLQLTSTLANSSSLNDTLPSSREDHVSSASVDIASSKDLGDCYNVMRNLFFNDDASNPGCWTDRFEFEYYNGGRNELYDDSGYPKETYQKVMVEVVKDCQTAGQPDNCTISVEGVGDCNACAVDKDSQLQVITMVDCSNLEGSFKEGDQTILSTRKPTKFQPQDKNLFFELPLDAGERCNHPAWTVTEPPTEQQDSMVEIKMKFDFTFWDGEGKQPTDASIASLLTATESYIRKVLHEDPLFSSIWGTVEITNVVDMYTTDRWQLEMITWIHYKEGEQSIRKSPGARANKIISQNRNLNDYLTNYVRAMGRLNRNIFYYIEKVKYRGVVAAAPS